MTITLSPESARLVQEKVASGLFDSPDDVVREAIDRMDVEFEFDDGAKLERLKAELAEGFADVDAGTCVPFSTREYIAEWKSRK